MFTKKFVKRSFKFKLHVKVWLCNRPLRLTSFMTLNKSGDVHIQIVIQFKTQIRCIGIATKPNHEMASKT